jgi:hypothetical protein
MDKRLQVQISTLPEHEMLVNANLEVTLGELHGSQALAILTKTLAVHRKHTWNHD